MYEVEYGKKRAKVDKLWENMIKTEKVWESFHKAEKGGLKPRENEECGNH